MRQEDGVAELVTALKSAERQKQQHDQKKCRTVRRKRAKANRGVRYAEFLQERQAHGRGEAEAQAQAQGESKVRSQVPDEVEVVCESHCQGERDQPRLHLRRRAQLVRRLLDHRLVHPRRLGRRDARPDGPAGGPALVRAPLLAERALVQLGEARVGGEEAVRVLSRGTRGSQTGNASAGADSRSGAPLRPPR